MGRVKRYRRSFYNDRIYWVKRIGGWVLVAAVLFGVGFLVAPRLLDLGTSIWYSTVRGQDADSTSQADSPASSTALATPAPTPTASPVPADTVTDGAWATLSLSALSSPEAIYQAASDLKAQGVAYALVPLKDASGYIYYASALPGAAGSIAATTVDAGMIAQALTEQGIVPVAYLCAFQDPISVYTDRSMAIHLRDSDYLWLDAASAEVGGKPWMNPYSDTAVQFIGDLIAEVSGLGYQQVVLSAVQFPSYVSEKQDFGDTAGLDRAGILAQDIAAWDQRFAGQVVLWYEVPYDSCVTPSTTLGSVTPDALGIQNLMIRQDEPVAADATPTQDEVIASLQGGGCTHVALRQGSSITLVSGSN